MKSTILTTLALLVSAAFLQAQEATAVKPTVLSKMANGTKLHQFDGTSMASAKLTKAPEYYILYFSASW